MVQLGATILGSRASSANSSALGAGGGGLSTAEGALDAEAILRERIKAMEGADKEKKLSDEKKMYLKNLQLEEARNSKYNMLKIQTHWRKIMRAAKTEALKKDIEVLSQNHERDVDRKDAILQMLDRDLDEAEEQYQTAQRNHLIHIDRLLELQRARLEALQQDFNKECQTIEDEFRKEREEMMKQHALEKKELLDIIDAVQQEENEKESEAQQEHEQMREEIKSKDIEESNHLKVILESTIEDLERHFDTHHTNHKNNTEQRAAEYKKLMKNDATLSKQIETKVRQIERLQASINQWKTKINQNAKECEERNQALKAEKEQISKHFQELKACMNRFRQEESKRLAELTANSRACHLKLKEQLDLSERILKTAEMCRKLETDKEKIMPFYEASETVLEQLALDPGLQAEIEAHMKHAIGEDGRPSQEWCYLDNFWKRFNKILLDKLAIVKEKMRLENENTELRSILKQYLDGISVNDDVMSAPNPLMVVNGKVNLNRPPVKKVLDRPAYVEAAQAVIVNRIPH